MTRMTLKFLCEALANRDAVPVSVPLLGGRFYVTVEGVKNDKNNARGIMVLCGRTSSGKYVETNVEILGGLYL